MSDKMYIAVLDEFPDHMVPTLVAHSVLSAHLKFFGNSDKYDTWLKDSFRKVVLRVNQKEFDKISAMNCHIGYELHTLGGKGACVVVEPVLNSEVPNVLKFAKMWKPINASE